MTRSFLPRTITTAGYTQPAVGGTVAVAVTNPKLYPVGAAVYIDGGGACGHVPDRAGV
jgi:hypothetical protein